MTNNKIYQDIAARTDGALMIGVVGPVRTGKSTFVKRFMETLVIPRIDNTYMKERAKDELPQSGSGKTIMTAEPKFVPENAVKINISEGDELSVRLVDCVGYMVDGAKGQFEDGGERMVTTPWFDYEVSLTEAAEKGTQKVICEHSTIGIVITTDGSICDIPRAKYEEAESRAINELKALGKPFVVLLNSSKPESEEARQLACEIGQKHQVSCISINCLTLNEKDINSILELLLDEFPIKSIGFYLPEWLEALSDENELKGKIYNKIKSCGEKLCVVRECYSEFEKLKDCEEIRDIDISKSNLHSGALNINIRLLRSVYYDIISKQTGFDVKNDGDMISTLEQMHLVKKDYDRIKAALEDVRNYGYGVVTPDSSQMTLEEPQIVRQGGKYGVKLKASAPVIHMIMTDVETEVSPAIGGETASEDIINFLLQGFEGDVNRIWQSNIFGKSLNDIAEEGLAMKIDALPENAKNKLRITLQRLINEGSSGLICILL